MTEPIREWRVRRVLPVVKGAGALAFAVMAVTGGRQLLFLAGIAAAGLAVLALRDVLAPVRLAADTEGVTVVAGFAGRLRIPWSEVQAVRVDERHYHGLRSRLLEIDTGDTIRSLSTYDLGGADTGDVAAELRELLDRRP